MYKKILLNIFPEYRFGGSSEFLMYSLFLKSLTKQKIKCLPPDQHSARRFKVYKKGQKTKNIRILFFPLKMLIFFIERQS